MTSRLFLLGIGSACALTLAAFQGASASAGYLPGPSSPLDGAQSARLARAVLVQRDVVPVPADTIPLYTAEQLARGTELYGKVCAECHEDADYTREEFRTTWTGKTLFQLFEEIRTKMPEDNPGSLTREQYADAMSYILKLNGVPAGPNAIAPDSAAMSAVTLNFVAPPADTVLRQH